MAMKSLVCPNCGAPIPIEGNARRLNCAFCGAPLDLGEPPAAQSPGESPEALARAGAQIQRQAEEEGYRRAKEEDSRQLADEAGRAEESRRQLQASLVNDRRAARSVRRRTHPGRLLFWLLVLGVAAFFLSPAHLPAPWQSRRAEAIRLIQTTVPQAAGLLSRAAAEVKTQTAAAQPGRLYSDEFFAADSVAHIRLSVLTPAGAPWHDAGGKTVAVVERQDGAGAWHAVPSWARVPNAAIIWSVARQDYGSGPFRWVVYAGATPLGVSRPFRLPTADGHMTDVVVNLSRLPG